MNGVLGHFCAHIILTGAGEPPEDGVMSEMTLPSRIWNSNPGGPRPSKLPLCHDPQEVLLAQLSLYVHTEAPHNIESLWERRKKRVVFLKASVGFEPAITDFPSRQL